MPTTIDESATLNAQKRMSPTPTSTKMTTARAATSARRRGLMGKSYGLRRHHSSIHDKDLTGDVARLVRSEKGDRVRDVFHRAEPSERDLREDGLLHAREKVAREVG